MKHITFLILLSIGLLAKEIPITNSITLYVPKKEFSVFEFPFKLKDLKFTPFISTVKKDDNIASLKEMIKVPQIESSEKKLPKKSKKRKLKKAKKDSPIIVDKGVNNVQLYPLKEGHTEFIVWGYKFPIMVKVIVDSTLGIKHYKFTDYSINKKEAEEFEVDTHEKILEKLTVALWKKKPPKGYKQESFFSEYKSSEFKFVLTQTFFGKKYIGEEWRVTNISGEKENLYPQRFLDKGVYSATPENNQLEPNETTRLFIVRAFNEQENENEPK